MIYLPDNSHMCGHNRHMSVSTRAAAWNVGNRTASYSRRNRPIPCFRQHFAVISECITSANPGTSSDAGLRCTIIAAPGLRMDQDAAPNIRIAQAVFSDKKSAPDKNRSNRGVQ